MLSVLINNKVYAIDIDKPCNISIPIHLNDRLNVNAYYAPAAYSVAFEKEGFVGLVKKGSPVNYRHIFISPHGHGTHTECVGHIISEDINLQDCVTHFHYVSYLLSITADINGSDSIIKYDTIKEKLQEAINHGAKAIIIRTLPNTDTKLTWQYSGTNPTYFESSIFEFLNENNIEHVLVDVPSLDKEQDGGILASHKAFWNYPDWYSRKHCTITELIYVPNECNDGLYWLNLMIDNIHHDAVPSSPILYPMTEVK